MRCQNDGNFSTARSLTFLALAVAVHVAVAIGYLRALPPFNWPDEPAHLYNVRSLAAGKMPAPEGDAIDMRAMHGLVRDHFVDWQRPEERELIERASLQAHQPPAYYALTALLYRFDDSPQTLKLVNLAISSLSLLVASAVGFKLSRDPAIALSGAALLALLPMRCFMAVSINNDAAAELIFTLFVLATLHGASPVAIGAILGIGLLTKASLLLALPLYGVWLAMSARRGFIGELLFKLLVATTTTVVIAAPWIGYNMLRYGWSDPLALFGGAFAFPTKHPGSTRLDLTNLDPGGNGPIGFLITLFQSGWGVFGWMEMYTRVEIYLVYLALTAVPIAGLIGASIRRVGSAMQRRIALWFAFSIATIIAGLALYSWYDYQPQGRYALLGATPLALIWATGARVIFGRWVWFWSGASAVALLAINQYVIRHVIPWYLAHGSQ
jgi:hypothetical protein